ncbi:AAA family ATPase [Gulosibacter faecalis]|uniref:AAA family ATPase n=1 Tax=Gulosibacter faecalis TaxID=272240 RepID=A0ABW5UX89_9MICO|nr:AAA family ATPase [Gulosibacter faecalis]
MWGIFKRQSAKNSDDERDVAQPVRDESETAPILDRGGERDRETDLDDGVAIGDAPTEWINQARASRSSGSRDAEANAFAPKGDTDAAPAARPAAGGDDSDVAAASASGPAADTDTTAPAPTDFAPPQLPEEAAQPVNLADAHERWRSELATLGGTSPLRNFAARRGTYIDLTTAHPSGIATLLARRPVMLSSLVREPIAFRTALEAAGLVARRGAELEAGRGLNTVHLAIGFASWLGGDGELHAPIFLRTASLRRLGRDYEIRLRGKLQPNVSLLRALFDDGAKLRASELMAKVGDESTLFPEAAFEYVREVGARLPKFEVDSMAALSTFADFASAMTDDAADLRHPVIDALAGDRDARRRLRQRIHTESQISPDRRDPASDRLLLDADTEQERVVDAILGGSSFVVETLPGTGVTQTVVNAIGHLVDRDRRVLVVTPRTASIRAIRARLKHTGLEGIAVTPRTLRRDVIAGISRNERAERPNTADLDDALVRLRRVLADYRGALTADHPELGVSPLDALEELSRLELRDVPPSTTARLGHTELVALRNVAKRAEVAEQMRELAELGEFRFANDESPWVGVGFESTEQVEHVHSTAVRLADGRVSELLRSGEKLVEQTNLRSPETFAELGIYLRLLADIRETLDRFTADIFDADLAELIEATGPRREGSDMSASRRRELRNYAREFVRPGVTVNELHDSLKYVQRQRIMWHRYVRDAAQPNVPTGIDAVRSRWRDINTLVQVVDEPLSDAGKQTLADTPIGELEDRLQQFAAKSEVLDNAVDRLALNERLRGQGLGDLLDDLGERHLEAHEVEDELELAWWQSALEELLATEKALLNANTRVLTRLESDFRVVDEAHTASSADQLAWQLAQAWKVALVDRAEEADALRELLRKPGLTSRQLVDQAAGLSRSVTQVWITTPYDVPRIDPRLKFDALLLVDSAAISTAEALGAIRRSSQVIAFGDPVTQYPTPFDVAVQPPSEPRRGTDRTEAEVEASIADTAYARLAELLPTVTLTRSYRAGGEDLTELVNSRFYGGRLHSMPWAGAFLGHSSLTYSYVPGGTGLPDRRTGTVEATDAEVTRVVELVLDHAIHRPRESLMVVSASSAHAERVEQAIWSAVSQRHDLAEFFTRPRSEPFIVATIEASAAQARDRVIFSLGYGVTPHGRVLSDFGVLGSPLGERALAVTMTRARRSLVIVTCVRPEQFEMSRLTRGTVGLAEILTELEERTEQPGGADLVEAGEAPMLVDLARRLGAFGMRVELGFRGEIPLAASYDNRAIVIDMDVAAGSGTTTTLRESLRLRPELLKRLGWYYLRVRAFELFANPEAVARRIAVALEVPIPDETGDLPELTMGKPQLPPAAAAIEPAAPKPASLEPASDANATDDASATASDEVDRA